MELHYTQKTTCSCFGTNVSDENNDETNVVQPSLVETKRNYDKSNAVSSNAKFNAVSNQLKNSKVPLPKSTNSFPWSLLQKCNSTPKFGQSRKWEWRIDPPPRQVLTLHQGRGLRSGRGDARLARRVSTPEAWRSSSSKNITKWMK